MLGKSPVFLQSLTGGTSGSASKRVNQIGSVPGNDHLRTRNPDGSIRGIRNLRIVYRARRTGDVEAYVLLIVPRGISPDRRLARETDA